MNFTAKVPLFFARVDQSDDGVWVSHHFHVGQTFGPGCRTHQPHEGKHSGHTQVLNTGTGHEWGLPQITWQRSAGLVNLQSEDPCCSPCTSQRRRCRCTERLWSRGRRRHRWWRRTQPRRSSRQPGRHAGCSHRYRWGHQNTPGGVWGMRRTKDFSGFKWDFVVSQWKKIWTTFNGKRIIFLCRCVYKKTVLKSRKFVITTVNYSVIQANMAVTLESCSQWRREFVCSVR